MVEFGGSHKTGESHRFPLDQHWDEIDEIPVLKELMEPTTDPDNLTILMPDALAGKVPPFYPRK